MSIGAPPRCGFLNGGGKMGALMRAHDWSTSALGEPERWPEVLKSAVATCLNSRFPMVVWWGPKLIMLYNDAWQPILGETKHPGGLGRPGADSWPDTWPIVGKQFENALKGVANWSEDLLLASDRHGYIEECYFTYSHSPLIDGNGVVVGVLTAVIETTARVLSERRMRALRDLSKATIEAATRVKSIEETCQHLLGILCSGNPDVPFIVQYLAEEGGCARLIASSHINSDLFPSSIAFSDSNDPWGLVYALTTREPRVVDYSEPSLRLQGGQWPESTTQLVALPLIGKSPQTDILGLLLVGVNSRLRLDEHYLDFLKLVAAELAGSTSALQSIERDMRSVRAKELLVRELQHRTRNLLAIVQSISERTRSTCSSLEDYAREFNGRLGALSRAQGLLSREESKSITIGELVHIELNALAAGDLSRITTGGPTVALPREAVQVLSLALHELATNSIKHGVLNGTDGSLQIHWRTIEAGSPVLRLEWIEGRGTVTERIMPKRQGFGRVLLEQALPNQLGGETHFDLRSEGLKCFLQFPLESKK